MKRKVLGLLSFVFCLVSFVLGLRLLWADPLTLSTFDKRTNALGGASSVYQQAPSHIGVTLTTTVSHDAGGKSLKLDYDKKGSGGPYGKGGWCGFYTKLKQLDKYFDASGYTKLTFWVKGAKGDENFRVGMSDRHWDELDDTVKSEDIGTYLPSGKITTDWQQAAVPLEVFSIDLSEIASVTFSFETECFSGGAGFGTVYIDDLALE